MKYAENNHLEKFHDVQSTTFPTNIPTHLFPLRESRVDIISCTLLISFQSADRVTPVPFKSAPRTSKYT